MESVSSVIGLVWVLLCFAIIAIGIPTAALGSSSGLKTPRANPGPAIVWTWLTTAMLVPLAAAVHGFNWVTALLIPAAWPTALWWHRHRGEHRAAFRETVRGCVLHVVETRASSSRAVARAGLTGLLALLLGVVLISAGHVDFRLPVSVDFDTFLRTRDLLSGTAAWDPLASLTAVVTRIAATDTLSAIRAMRLALMALTAAAAAALIVEIVGRPAIPAVIVAAAGLIAWAPFAPLNTWAISLLLLLGATSWLRWARNPSCPEGWHAVAAIVLVALHVVPFWDRPEALWQVSRTARYLEYRAAAAEAQRLVRLSADDDWVLVGAPEQQLEIDGRGRFCDLAAFVSRFHDRAGDPGFRFDLGGARLFVFVEKEPFDVSHPMRGRFVAAEPVAYRVWRERARLEGLAGRICDDYRRSHAGTVIVYDDAEVRIYRIDV